MDAEQLEREIEELEKQVAELEASKPGHDATGAHGIKLMQRREELDERRAALARLRDAEDGDDSIAARVEAILDSLPPHVLLVAAAKTRTPDEARAAVEAGVTALGHNYVQQAEEMRAALTEWETQRSAPVRWHFIGHLQRNKVKKAVQLSDMIETIDSIRLAREVSKECAKIDKVMPVLIEINSGEESAKDGVTPDDAETLVREIATLPNVRVQGLMTMGPPFGDPEDARPYFQLTKKLFDSLAAASIDNVDMRHLSMGMSNSYRVAVEEGATIVRIGTKLFGERD